MTKEEAQQFVADTFDDDSPEQDEIEAAFEAIYERPADSDDRENGLWSLICCATSHCSCSTRSEHETTTVEIRDEAVSAEYTVRGDIVTHVTSDGCPDDLLDLIEWDQPVDKVAEDVFDVWATGYEGDVTNINVTVRNCSGSGSY